MSKETKHATVNTSGFLVSCMDCHNGKPDAVNTKEEAQTWADIHLSIDSKMHGEHTVVIIPAQLVRKGKSDKVFTATCTRCGMQHTDSSPEQARTNALQCNHL